MIVSDMAQCSVRRSSEASWSLECPLTASNHSCTGSAGSILSQQETLQYPDCVRSDQERPRAACGHPPSHICRRHPNLCSILLPGGASAREPVKTIRVIPAPASPPVWGPVRKPPCDTGGRHRGQPLQHGELESGAGVLDSRPPSRIGSRLGRTVCLSLRTQSKGHKVPVETRDNTGRAC